MSDPVQTEICARIAKFIAEKDIYDPMGYETLAALKLPGPDYLQVLSALHGSLRPKLYVEIGVRRGASLRRAGAQTKCIAIDPEPALEYEPSNTLLAITTSDKFFANPGQRSRAEGFDLAFIDGDHSFDQALRDFNNLEALAKPSSIIAIHDVIPMDARTATPQVETAFHTGDVWRLMMALCHFRPDLVAFTIACPPTGLGIVGRFGGGGMCAFDEAWMRQKLNMDWDVLRQSLKIVPNRPDAILAALQGKQAA